MANSFTSPIRQTPVYSAASAIPGTVVDKAFLLNAYAGRYTQDPQVFHEVWNKYIRKPSLSMLIDKTMGRAYSQRRAFATIENDYIRQQVKIASGGGPYTVPAFSAGTNTVVLPLDIATMQLSGTFVMPQRNEYIAAPPLGELLEITAVTASGGTPSITVRHKNPNGLALTINAGQEMPHLTGRLLADCASPDGNYRWTGMPIVSDNTMEEYADGQTWCGDAIDEDRPFWLPVRGSDGSEVYLLCTNGQIEMMRKFEDSMAYQTLLNDKWGVVPGLKQGGTILQHNNTTDVTREDIYYAGTQLTQKGVTCKTYMVTCGRDKFVKYMNLFNSQPTATNPNFIGPYDPRSSTKMLNLEWTELRIGGLHLYIVEDEMMSSGLGLGAANYKFRNAEIWTPLEPRPFDVVGGDNDWARNETSSNYITKVFFESKATNEVFDCLAYSSGILTKENNPYEAGTRKNKFTIQSRWCNVLHGLPAICCEGLFT